MTTVCVRLLEAEMMGMELRRCVTSCFVCDFRFGFRSKVCRVIIQIECFAEANMMCGGWGDVLLPVVVYECVIFCVGIRYVIR